MSPIRPPAGSAHRLASPAPRSHPSSGFPAGIFERDNAERNIAFIAHTSPVHQDPLENVSALWMSRGSMGTAFLVLRLPVPWVPLP